MKQTAVEYIKEKLLSDEYWYKNMTFEQIFEQAKAIEKEQIIKAWDNGQFNCGEFNNPTIIFAEQYYTETFKSE